MASNSNLQSLVYQPRSSVTGAKGPTLQVLDQLLIPREKAYIQINTIQDAWQVSDNGQTLHFRAMMNL